MTARRARFSLLAALACAALAVAGCGNKHAVVTEAETEGIYVDVGPLDYQVQLSRILNPSVIPDRDYFRGLPEAELSIGRDEAWFAIFIRVQNATDRVAPSAEEFEIVDTQENVYRPLEFEEGINPIAYRAVELEPKGLIPAEDSVAADAPTQGALLLFKVPNSTLQNRPLEFKIKSPAGPEAEGVVNLDV